MLSLIKYSCKNKKTGFMTSIRTGRGIGWTTMQIYEIEELLEQTL